MEPFWNHDLSLRQWQDNGCSMLCQSEGWMRTNRSNIAPDLRHVSQIAESGCRNLAAAGRFCIHLASCIEAIETCLKISEHRWSGTMACFGWSSTHIRGIRAASKVNSPDQQTSSIFDNIQPMTQAQLHATKSIQKSPISHQKPHLIQGQNPTNTSPRSTRCKAAKEHLTCTSFTLHLLQPQQQHSTSILRQSHNSQRCLD